MKFPNDFWELIVIVSLLITGGLIYAIATRNRGSFADTPDWSKVIRRIIELACVFIALLFIPYIGWTYSWKVRIIVIVLPFAGILTGFLIPKILTIITERKNKNKHFKDNLAEHLINAIILALFFLSALLVGFITLIKIFGEATSASYCLVILDFLLSTEFAFLFYQLHYLIFVNNLPSEEIVQIIRICKELND